MTAISKIDDEAGWDNHFQEYLPTIVKSGHIGLSKAIQEIREVQYDPFIRRLDNAQEKLLQHKKEQFDAALLWVGKTQTKIPRKREAPFDSEYFRIVEPWGAHLNATLELCNAILDVLDDFPQIGEIFPGTTALGWWAQIMIEIKLGTFERKINPTPSVTKTSHEANCKAEIKKLKSFQLPEGNTLRDELDRIAVIIAKPQPSDNNQIKRTRRKFREEAWKKYLDTAYDWATAQGNDSRLGRVLAIEGKLVRQAKGRQKTVLYPKPTGFLKQKRKPEMIKTSDI